ncbi:hypothetical protein, partial [Actinacidiphila oryziradicis]|uniref:hypothetical protein n=1 Tax=Actinacidiphila oryziradicis TaxID=2571141 RepID=UPI0023F581F9
MRQSRHLGLDAVCGTSDRVRQFDQSKPPRLLAVVLDLLAHALGLGIDARLSGSFAHLRLI